MSDRLFVDSNVWVYALDADEPVKREQARRVLGPEAAHELVVSAQVLGEFYVTVTRKLARPVGVDVAAEMIGRMRQLPVVAIDSDLVGAALAGVRSWRLSYWDALIVAAARSAGCSRLVTEDLADGAVYDGVRVVNPFAAGHRVAEERLAIEARPGSWDDDELAVELERYEGACRGAGMRPNAVHSYWDYARRFLAWRTGEYRPRGVVGAGRPVPLGRATIDDLERQAREYTATIGAAGREQPTVDTYHRHAMFFIRWLRGTFRPGDRLRMRE